MARLGAALCLCALLSSPLGAQGAAHELAFDPAGTWYVLVHYTDVSDADPEALHWEDALWVFERSGEYLHWRVYPRPRFEDVSGRAEAAGAWEPSEAQRAEIARGLRGEEWGVLSASLAGSDASGWSSGRRNGAASASALGFSRHWAIEGLPASPVFRRREQLGGPQAEDLAGETRHEVNAAADSGGLTGAFTRDGVQSGRFWIWRSGPAPVPGEGEG